MVVWKWTNEAAYDQRWDVPVKLWRWHKITYIYFYLISIYANYQHFSTTHQVLATVKGRLLILPYQFYRTFQRQKVCFSWVECHIIIYTAPYFHATLGLICSRCQYFTKIIDARASVVWCNNGQVLFCKMICHQDLGRWTLLLHVARTDSKWILFLEHIGINNLHVACYDIC